MEPSRALQILGLNINHRLSTIDELDINKAFNSLVQKLHDMSKEGGDKNSIKQAATLAEEAKDILDTFVSDNTGVDNSRVGNTDNSSNNRSSGEIGVEVDNEGINSEQSADISSTDNTTHSQHVLIESKIQKKEIKHEDIPIHLCIDTRFRKEYYKTTSADFQIQFSKPFKHVESMSLITFEMPRCIYAVSDKMGTNLVCIRNPTQTGTWVDVKISDGNYTASEIATEMTSKITKALNDVSYSVITEQQNEKIIIQHNTDKFDIHFKNHRNEAAPPMENLGWLLGYRYPKYVHNEASDLSSSWYQSDAIADVRGPKYMYLAIDDHQYFVHHNIIGIYEQSFLSKNILAKIPLKENSDAIVSRQDEVNMFKKRHYTGLINLDKINIQLLTPYGTVIDTNGIDYSFTLELIIIQ